MTETNDQPKLTIRQSIKVLVTASRGYQLVNLANFGDGIAYFGFLALMVIFMKENIGFSAHWSTVSISLFSGAVTIFMALGAGAITDRLGVRRALTLVWFFLIAGRVVFTLSPTGGSMFVTGGFAALGLFLMAAGEGVIQPAVYAGVKQYTDERTKTLGYAFLYAIMNLGIIVGEIISPLVRGFWAENVEGLSVEQNPAAGIVGAYWFFTLVTVAMLVIHLSCFTKKVEKRDRKVFEQPQEEQSKTTFVEKLKALPILNPRFIFFIFILLPVRTLFAHQFLTMPLFVERAFPAVVAAKWEWVYMINPIIIVIFVPLIAALTLRKRVIHMMIVGTAISAFCAFLLCTKPNIIMLVTYMVIFSLGEAFWFSRFLEYIADLAPVSRVGIYMGIATIPWFLAKMTTGFYAGAMLDIFVPETGAQSPEMLWLIYGLIGCISPIGLFLARRWLITGVRHQGEQ